MTMMFPLSRWNEFCEKKARGEINPALRIGQAFHQFMDLDKITSHEKTFCDRLYEADNEKAVDLIDARLDESC